MSSNWDVLVVPDDVNSFDTSFLPLFITTYSLIVFEVRFESHDNNYFYGEEYLFTDIFFIKYALNIV